MPKQYRTAQPVYLRMKGNPTGDPVLIEEGVIIGEDTPFDFDGPPSMGMVPLNDEAGEAHQEMLDEAAGKPPTVKDTAAPSEGGASPFDPASSQKSDAEKAADKKKAEDEAAAKAKAEADAKSKTK